jgi:nitroreductase
MNTILETIKNRRSTRSFEQEQIKQSDLEMILEAAIYAPTAHNDQPWHFTVIQNKELLADINTKSKLGLSKSTIDWRKEVGNNPKTNLMYNAPTLIIVSGRKDAVAPMIDCSAAIQNMLLTAESLGLGTVWLGLIREYFSYPEELAALQIPAGYEPYYGVALGYKKNKNKMTAPKRNPDVVTYLR